jgi:homoserine trans-succinylase
MDAGNIQQVKEERIVDRCRKEMLSALIIPLQAQIDVLEEIRKYEKINCHERLSELYKEINKLRDEYFDI